MHRKVAAAIVAALALAVAGCGGSESTTVDRAELVKRVSAACRAAENTAAKAAARAQRSDNPFAAYRAGQELLLERVEDLDTSGSAKADFDAYKEGLRTRFAAFEKVAAASRAERERVIRSLQREAEAAAKKIETSARRLGFRGCG
jgi:hypothetical protein